MEIVKLIPQNIKSVAERTGRSEEDLMRSYILATSQNKICLVMIHKLEEKKWQEN